MLDKALYELGYELNNRPDWVRIPLPGSAQSWRYGLAEVAVASAGINADADNLDWTL